MSGDKIESREILIDGHSCSVTCAKTGKTTWKAWGDSNGKHVTATSNSSYSNAFDVWERTALSLND